MAIEKITSTSQLAKRLKLRRHQIREAVMAGARRGARGARAVLVIRSPKDRGNFKAAWRSKSFLRKSGEIARVSNDAPYAGIIERGARPHGVNKEGREALFHWVRRHFSDSTEEEQIGITYAIINKIRLKGQKPTLFVRKSLPDLRKLLTMETERALKQQAGRTG